MTEQYVKLKGTGIPASNSQTSTAVRLVATKSYSFMAKPMSTNYIPTSVVDLAIMRTRRIKLVLYRQLFSSNWRLRKWITGSILVLVVYLHLSLGIFFRFIERDFSAEFDYPQHIENFSQVVDHYMEAKELPYNVTPVNLRYSKLSFLSGEHIASEGPVGLLIVVKSAVQNYEKRMAIRKTYGDEAYLRKNVISADLPTKLVFISGAMEEDVHQFSSETQYNDLVIAQFHDSYANNTYKIGLALRWATDYVQNFKYLMIVDDDMFIDLANTISWIHKLPGLPVEEVESVNTGTTAYFPVEQRKDPKATGLLNDQPVMMGHLIHGAKPFRSYIGSGSIWYVSSEVYPFNYYPPYIAGGATIFDHKTVRKLYYGSLFTKHFWIDDVYLGIIAFKMGIKLIDNNLMDSSYDGYNNEKTRSKFPRMLAMHGLKCPEQLLELWRTRNLESLSYC